MKPASDFRSRSPGFTLVELVIVMFIMVMLMMIAVPSVGRFSGENALRSCTRDLATQARAARRLAIQQQRAYEVRFDPTGFHVAPLEAGTNIEEFASDELPPPRPLPAGITWQITRWAERQPSKEPEDAWVFEPSGVCEPLRVRFDRADSWIELAFHPLTAAVSEERYEFR
jgi:type II secretion system protein H